MFNVYLIFLTLTPLTVSIPLKFSAQRFFGVTDYELKLRIHK